MLNTQIYNWVILELLSLMALKPNLAWMNCNWLVVEWSADGLQMWVTRCLMLGGWCMVDVRLP